MKYTILDLPYGIRVDIENEHSECIVLLSRENLAKHPISEIEKLLDQIEPEIDFPKCGKCRRKMTEPIRCWRCK
jgi:hypothetical protein